MHMLATDVSAPSHRKVGERRTRVICKGDSRNGCSRDGHDGRSDGKDDS